MKHIVVVFWLKVLNITNSMEAMGDSDQLERQLGIRKNELTLYILINSFIWLIH